MHRNGRKYGTPAKPVTVDAPAKSVTVPQVNQINSNQNLVEYRFVIAAGFEQDFDFVLFIFAKRTIILRRFRSLQFRLKMHGFIDIGPHSYKIVQNLKLFQILT